MNLIRTSGIEIPKTHIDCLFIQTNLNRWVQDMRGNSKNMKFYEDMGDRILVPRFYPVTGDIEDLTCDGDDIQIQSNIVPRSERQRKAIHHLSTNRNGILKLEPGIGKTVAAIATICNIGKKTIVLAHKSKLCEQWEKEFYKHTDATEDDIGILTGSNYKKVLQKSIIISTPHVIFINAEKGKTAFLDALKNANIGTLFIDECHVGVGPEKFSKASSNIYAKRVFGLSATPTRADGNDDIMKFHLGEIVSFPAEEDELIKPIVYMMYFPFGIYSRYKKYLNWGGTFDMTKYYKQMGKIESFNKKVAKWIVDAYEKDRRVLVLGKNVDPLISLCETMNLPKEDLGLFSPAAHDKKYLKRVSKLTDTTDMDESFLNKKVVVSTYNYARDGNNREELDCLFMICPTGNVEQAAGRVLRRLEGKKQPKLIDLIDLEGPECKSYFNPDNKVSMWVRMAEKRKEFYISKGWEVKEIFL